ncbi:hypothetical protein MBLNU230_g3046t1 [Neophaeotheca triangularis]
MANHRWGVILDAGSSGTRIYIYKWKTAPRTPAKTDKDAAARRKLPELETHGKWRKKAKPGISTYGSRPEQVGPEHLKELVEFALDVVPKHQVPETPIFLLATAGMRLLPERERAEVLENVCAYFRQNTDFQLPDCGLHVQVIPGETEGLYGWVAANYLLGGFDAPEKQDIGAGHDTYGFLDMGGASAQIAFAPNATEAEAHADDLQLLRLRRVDGQALEYRVFVTTWLGFGANEARRRYVEGLLDAYSGQKELPDPCLPVGLLAKTDGTEIEAGSPEAEGDEPYLLGTGNFPECLKKTYPLLEKDKACVNAPCLLDGVHTPAIDFDVNHFVGVSEYWHTTHEVFAKAHTDKAYDFHTFQKQVIDFCSRDWTDIEQDVAGRKWGEKVDEKTVEEVCFKASWLISMLHDGIGVPRVGIEGTEQPGQGDHNKTNSLIENAKDRGFIDPFQAVDKIHGTEVSWTLGKMVLYASSQMPADENAMAVGFGSNTPDDALPDDFQFAGGTFEQFPAGTDDSLRTEDWHDRVFSSDSSQRIPGIILFLLILGLVAYFLAGRERRSSLKSKISTLCGRRPSSKRGKRQAGFLGGKLFGGGSKGSPTYERVLEDGVNAEDFELTTAADEEHLSDGSASSSHDSARTGRTSGWATPAHRGLSPDFSRASPKTKGYLDGGGASGTAGVAGLGIAGFDKGGLMSRTESKERLAIRSRAGSPVRKSPLMTGFKESVD